jgi:hypothetical protein
MAVKKITTDMLRRANNAIAAGTSVSDVARNYGVALWKLKAYLAKWREARGIRRVPFSQREMLRKMRSYLRER